VSIRWSGIDDVINGLDGIAGRARAALPEAGVAAMTHIAQASAELVPVETGTLLNSQKISGSEDGTTTVSYGTPYARYQHERLDLRHEHGQAKYLEQPMHTEKDTALDIAADTIKRAL
jgi:hypothetical protein